MNENYVTLTIGKQKNIAYQISFSAIHIVKYNIFFVVLPQKNNRMRAPRTFYYFMYRISSLPFYSGNFTFPSRIIFTNAVSRMIHGSFSMRILVLYTVSGCSHLR